LIFRGDEASKSPYCRRKAGCFAAALFWSKLRALEGLFRYKMAQECTFMHVFVMLEKCQVDCLQRVRSAFARNWNLCVLGEFCGKKFSVADLIIAD
jgi:hypothetical protein